MCSWKPRQGRNWQQQAHHPSDSRASPELRSPRRSALARDDAFPRMPIVRERAPTRIRAAID
ncbi:hypothetical protein EIQ17_07880 [Xanthomonas campestris pv. campestris]